MRRLFLACTTIVLAACGSASNPNAPSPLETGSNGSGAVITGTVSGAGSAQIFNTTSNAAGMTVTIEGTNLTATVNTFGTFTFSNVPPGSITLRFTGAGASNATVSVGVVSAGETLTITVTVTGSTAEVTSQVRGNGTEIEGRIEQIQGTTLTVAGRTVTTSASTTIRHGESSAAMSFSDLLVGMRVHVKGTPTGTGAAASTAASLIIVQNLNTAIPTQLDGAVSDLTGNASAFQFKIGSAVVKGNTSTEFSGGSIPQFAGLGNGVDVHVTGTQQNGFVQATRIVLKGGGSPQPGTTWTGSGNAGGVTGTCPSLTFGVKGITVRTSASTTFGGVTCAAFKNGTSVTVTGTTQADGAVLASSVVKS